MELVLINGCESKRILRKDYTSKITTNLKNTFYVDKEIQDIKKNIIK